MAKKVVFFAILAFSLMLPVLAQSIPQITSTEEGDPYQGLDTLNRIVQLKTIVVRALDKSREKMNPGMGFSLSRTVEDAYSPEILYRYVSENFSKMPDNKRFAPVFDWFHTPLGFRLAQVQMPIPPTIGQIHSNPIPAQSPSSARLALIRKLDESQGISATTMEFFDLMIQNYIKEVSPPEYRDRRGGYNGGIENHVIEDMSYLKQAVQDETTASLLLEYQNFSDDELKQIADFIRAEDGHWYVRTFHQAFIDALHRDLG